MSLNFDYLLIKKRILEIDHEFFSKLRNSTRTNVSKLKDIITASYLRYKKENP